MTIALGELPGFGGGSSSSSGGGGGGEEAIPTYTVVYGSVTVPDAESPEIIELAEKTLVVIDKEVTDICFFSMWFKTRGTGFSSSFGGYVGILEGYVPNTNIDAPCVRVRSTQFQGYRMHGDPTSHSTISKATVSAATTHAIGEDFGDEDTEGVAEMFISPTSSNVTDVRHHCRHGGGDGEQRDTAASNVAGHFSQTYGPGEGNTVKFFACTDAGRPMQINLSKIVGHAYGTD